MAPSQTETAASVPPTLPTTSSRRQSCDRCYGQKLRCTRQGKEGACNRCLKQGAQCKSRNPKTKITKVTDWTVPCLEFNPGFTKANRCGYSNRCIQYVQLLKISLAPANICKVSACPKVDHLLQLWPARGRRLKRQLNVEEVQLCSMLDSGQFQKTTSILV